MNACRVDADRVMLFSSLLNLNALNTSKKCKKPIEVQNDFLVRATLPKKCTRSKSKGFATCV